MRGHAIVVGVTTRQVRAAIWIACRSENVGCRRVVKVEKQLVDHRVVYLLPTERFVYGEESTDGPRDTIVRVARLKPKLLGEVILIIGYGGRRSVGGQGARQVNPSPIQQRITGDPLRSARRRTSVRRATQGIA